MGSLRILASTHFDYMELVRKEMKVPAAALYFFHSSVLPSQCTCFVIARRPALSPHGISLYSNWCCSSFIKTVRYILVGIHISCPQATGGSSFSCNKRFLFSLKPCYVPAISTLAAPFMIMTMKNESAKAAGDGQAPSRPI